MEPSSEITETELVFNNKHIIIAHQNIEEALILTKSLEDLGGEVIFVNRSIHVLRQIGFGNYDLVILDYEEGMFGTSLVIAMLHLWARQLPVMIFSSINEVSLREMGITVPLVQTSTPLEQVINRIYEVLRTNDIY